MNMPVRFSHTSIGVPVMLDGDGVVAAPSSPSSAPKPPEAKKMLETPRPSRVRALHVDQVEHAGVGLHAVGHDVRQRAEDQRNDEVPDDVAPAGGRRRIRR